MKFTKDLPLGLRFVARPSGGSKPVYAVVNPYGRYGLMVGWNVGQKPHHTSLVKDAQRRQTDAVYHLP